MTGNTSPGAYGGDAGCDRARGGENDARPEPSEDRQPAGYRGRHRRSGTGGTGGTGNGGSGGHGGPDRPPGKRAAR
ncbi:hypothetical protein ACIBCT_14330 [Streptosporangium sp. NPDC050855]|uniref:hypothetical protein n=1 Tax=Streptosporangium sp. NPDC050855 TaxID=3366194 RepID=UPI0037ADE9B0